MIWCNRPSDFIPFPHFGICLADEDFKKTLKKLKVAEKVPFMADADAFASTHCMNFDDGRVVCIVTLRGAKGRGRPAVYGLIAHEAVHIWQKVREMMGESEPSSEFEAYSVQFICTQLFHAYEESK